ncbi:TetR/AcrR family transcriptional regulator [Rhodococcus rhodochrous]|uniref:TetR/AcrR family transcriptional regulator n=1 Tax=Rhodococcus rhodochrous TaxID=1829 RepID=A0AA46WVA4_RHORH|nr:TetR/AcrR family transcriptional regulator [Rhodococcus rhodochrous]AYA27390.1 TetR/AcrR family transcriptional regulator [Rhodococcus rhodochrous]MBF4481012.1 TetR/AcrR family transcriptional regulator [Rhodococcus rhodochrous]MCB8909664.1 TetR/AcrR family transcriptional regulator [Rhodococcus rhodochrous]MDO1485347.1 TetR/AcrR family transcriptional regulator [Rhodococcus rhodochrous]TWH44561.1 transcriptional regulator, TetR family [Rhodococcus rhodochrous J38]
MATIVRREDYFDAALAILATNDHAGLKQARLCSHLEVTTGSFYNYFESWAQFKTEFLQHWLESQTLQLAAAARLEGSMTRRLRLLVEFACSLPHSAESAIRGWSHSDSGVHEVQSKVDELRYAVVAEAVAQYIGSREQAERFARLALYALVGYQQTVPLQDVNSLRWSLAYLLGTLLPEEEAAGLFPSDSFPPNAGTSGSEVSNPETSNPEAST